MPGETTELTNLHPDILKFQNEIRNRYILENRTAKRGQILFVGSSIMEIFPIDQLQQGLGLDKVIYNRGVRATTTADLLAHIAILIFDLAPSKIFINIGSNDIGFGVPEETFLANYEKLLKQIKIELPDAIVYVMKFFPINISDFFGEENIEHDQLYMHRSNELLKAANVKIEKLTKYLGYEFIDLNKGLTVSNGNLKRELTLDGTHMLIPGYKIVLDNMKEYL